MTETSNAPPELDVRQATEPDEQVLDRLWQLFRYDMSRQNGARLQPDGLFKADHLKRSRQALDAARYIAFIDARPVGFATLRGIGSQTVYIESFFVVAPERSRGRGESMARQVIANHPGSWSVAFQPTNDSARRFWRRLATSIDPAGHSVVSAAETDSEPGDMFILFSSVPRDGRSNALSQTK